MRDTTTKLSDVAYREMLDLIRDGTWATKSRLPSENEMAASFGVSRPVIRQALARLREEGLISSRRGSGSFVTRTPTSESQFPSITSIADITSLAKYREGIESESAALAAERRSEEQLERLTAFSACPQGGTSEEGADRDFDFHMEVATASGNPFYINTLLSLREQVRICMNLTWNIAVVSADFTETVNREHRTILETIRDGDPERARSAMRKHIHDSHARLMRGRPLG
ncbi:FadR/GntR family transcriptional regulator [Roseicyclus sp. F158]|uniref:FadR/GntR family transcriptional regulator n=1 Tax=Tropicimonas omnivorans TaxID=3075590 RepID=A0ABU3DF52_9RHOB|nr:FadR/GntR family transcriptional regulator [Roseicyclus sp. F158]MDT0682320.1 FadR/GntR family transcriptional regulator [Roseicyclus sp. F158]